MIFQFLRKVILQDVPTLSTSSSYAEFSDWVKLNFPNEPPPPPEKIPMLEKIILNKNILAILTTIGDRVSLSEVNYYANTLQTEENHEWCQKSVKSPSIIIRIHLDNTNIENGVMQIIPGSQGKIFTKDEIKVISENSIPRICEMSSGAIHINNPMILHSVQPPTTSKKRRVIQMEYT